MAALHGRPLGLLRCRLDLGFRRTIRLGDLSLWPLGAVAARGLGLGSGQRMGSGLGFLAHQQRLRRLGSVAAGSAVRSPSRHPQLGGQLLRHRPRPIRLCPGRGIWVAACAPFAGFARAECNDRVGDDECDQHHFFECHHYQSGAELRRNPCPQPPADGAISPAPSFRNEC